jgi:hypothetical protein
MRDIGKIDGVKQSLQPPHFKLRRKGKINQFFKRNSGKENSDLHKSAGKERRL